MHYAQSLASDIIINLSMKHKLEKDLLYALLEKQQDGSVKNYRLQFLGVIKENLDSKYKRKNLHCRNARIIFGFKRVIPYLSIEDKPF